MKDFAAVGAIREEAQRARISRRMRARLHPETIQNLMCHARVQAIPADTVVWQDGMQIASVGVLYEGYLRFQRIDLEGRRQIAGLILPGDLLGERVHGKPGFSLEASTDAMIIWFDRETYDAALRKDRSLRRAHYRNSMTQVDRLRWLTWMVGALHPDERLATFLTVAKAIMPWRSMTDGAEVLTIALNRRDIADLLATTPETICRTLKLFEQEGLIRMHDPSHMEVLDRAGLVKRAALLRDPVADQRWQAASPIEEAAEMALAQVDPGCRENPEAVFL